MFKKQVQKTSAKNVSFCVRHFYFRQNANEMNTRFLQRKKQGGGLS